MALAIKIGIFLVFLLIFAAFAFGSQRLVKVFLPRLGEGNWVWFSEIMIVIGVVQIAATVYLISGYFNFYLYTALLLVSQLGVLVATCLRYFLPVDGTDLSPQLVWFGLEPTRRYPKSFGITVIVISLMSLAYPVVAGIVYFGSERGSPELTFDIFKWTFALLMLPGYVLILLPAVINLSSRYIAPSIRKFTLINSVTAMVSLGLTLGVTVAAFGYYEPKPSVAVDVRGIGTPGIVMLSILLLFALGILVPYVFGEHNGQKWTNAVLDKKKKVVGAILDSLQKPVPSEADRRLGEIEEEIDAETTALSDDPMVQLGVKLNAGETPPELGALGNVTAVFVKAEPHDSRFNYLKWLDEQKRNLMQVRDQLASVSPAGRDDIVKRWVDYIKPLSDQLAKDVETAGGRKTVVRVLLGSVGTVLLSALASESAKHIFKLFAGSVSGME